MSRSSGRSARRIRRTVDQRRAILRRFQQSGLGPTDFCKREHLSLSSLQRWRRELEPEDMQPDFIELVPPANDGAPSGGWALELDLPGGLCLRIRGGV